MVEFVFRISIALVVFLCGTVIFRVAAGRLTIRYPNIISLTYYHILVFQFIGSSLLFVGVITENWWVNQAANSERAVYYAFTATSFSFVFLPILVYFFLRLMGTIPRRWCITMYERPVGYINGHSDRLALPLLTLLLLVLFATGYFIVSSLETVPLVQLVIGADAEALALYRRQASKLPFILRIAHNVFARWIGPILTLVAYGYAKKSGKLHFFLIFALFFSTTSLLLVYRLEKAPIIQFVAMIIIARALYQRGLRWKAIFFWLIIAFLVLIGMYVTVMGAGGVSEALSSIMSRIFVSQHVGTVLAFDYFPTKETYIGGYSFFPLSSRLFGEQLTESFAMRLMRFYNPGAWRRGSAGYTATFFVAEAFANWGIVGILLGNIIVSAFLAVSFHLFTRVAYHPVSIAVIAYLSLKVPAMINSGLRFAIYSPELTVSLILLLLYVVTVRGRAILRLRHQRQIGIVDILLPRKEINTEREHSATT